MRRWRQLLRGWHRDFGYIAVGLTVVYAVSGLAVNHIADWDPSFRQIDRTHALPPDFEIPPAPGPDADAEEADRALGQRILDQLGIDEPPRDVYRATATELQIVLDQSTLHVDTATGTIQEEGQRPRFLLRIANWLHLNRGKRAWTYIADAYAVILLLLAGSGLVMLPGRGRGIGRRGLLVASGVAVPVLYVVLSGGP